jgi:hypothetical protein
MHILVYDISMDLLKYDAVDFDRILQRFRRGTNFLCLQGEAM